MPQIDRRRFLQLAGGSAAMAALTPSIARAATIPAQRRHGSIDDVEHVVVLMQENRSFDHYFGTMRGVRGYGDPHPAVLPSGKPVWYQSDGTTEILPFRPNLNDVGLAFIEDLDHSWNGSHAAFADGAYDQWIPAKSSTTMAHLARRDIPFHYALAEAFTICDGYHCSLLGPTDPNRYYMWTGWVGNDGKGGGPVIANDELGYDWMTYPERLLRAGVSWKVYQDKGVGLDAKGYWGWTEDAYIGNYGDNSLLYFDNYRNAEPGDPLYVRARTGTDVSKGGSFFSELERDVRADQLPQISYIVAPEAFTEHPNWPANFGAWYVARMLDALTSNPDVWSKTALLLTFDENDGFFDHAVPPYPNVGTLPGKSSVPLDDELYTGAEGVPGPYGLGVRVPMTVISPWSTGGWVCSETFDHTSIIRFMERRFGVHEPNITPWRRAVCGDLTSAFDFGRKKSSIPQLPSTAAYKPKNDKRHDDYVPKPPAHPARPEQEPGTRPARALGYDLAVTGNVSATSLRFVIANRGRLGAQLQARSTTVPEAPFSYTVGAGHRLSPELPAAGTYDISFHGPNGFFRRFGGDTTTPSVETALRSRDGGQADLEVTNSSSDAVRVRIVDAYDGSAAHVLVPAGGKQRVPVDLGQACGWYDLTVTVPAQAGFVRVLAGHLEDGRPSVSDPQLGR